MKVPFIPENTPFSDDQKSWLNGFFSGLHTQMSIGQESVNQSAESALCVNVLYGTQTGNAEMVCEDVCDALGGIGITTKMAALDDIEVTDLLEMDHVLVVTSTYGEGEMPDNAELFWDAFRSTDAPRLEQLQFAVLSLGDTGYDEFCEAGKQIDLRFEQLGAKRLHARVDCDVDYEELAEGWTSALVVEFEKLTGDIDGSVALPTKSKKQKSKWTRKTPYPGALTLNRLLSKEGSAKEIRHFEIALEEGGPVYEAGDALGVIPQNDPALVSAWLERLQLAAETPVGGFDKPLGELLLGHFEISTPSGDFVKAIEARANDVHLSHVVEHGDREALDAYLWSKDSLDLLNAWPDIKMGADDLAGLLKPLQHRAYSISSSSKLHPDSVHLTIASVRFESHGRKHGGVASTFLADRVSENATVPVFVTPNKAFRVPTDNDVPMIMVGPGTGIAPFRAFLQERQEIGAKGMNWLFFGDQHAATDFSYEDELLGFQKSGLLSGLDLAFSRDQEQKIYVQTRMMEKSKRLFAALQDGGHFYVCGDATRMAKDVDQMLHKVIAREGGLTADGAHDYVNAMKKDKRYVRDVY